MTVMTPDQAADHLTSTDPRFALGTETIRGVEYKILKNAPQNLRALLQEHRTAHGGGDGGGSGGEDGGGDDYLVYGDERWTYDEFCRDANRLSDILANQLNVKPGDRIALAMRNYPEILIAKMATINIGAVVVFLNGWWTTEELDYALGDSNAKLVFADGERLQRLTPLVDKYGLQLIGIREGEAAATHPLSELIARAQSDAWPTIPILPDDDFAIMYSSGTTGHPKGVVLTHRGAISAIYSWWCTQLLIPMMTEPDVLAQRPVRPQASLVITPLFHVTATHAMFLLSIPMGSKLVLMYKWDAEEAVRLIQHEEITRFMGVPTQSADLMETARRLNADLPSLEFVGSGGAKRPPSQVSELQDCFPQAAIASGWGMTETNAIGIGILGPDYVARPTAAGRLYPPLQQLKILDDSGVEVANGEIGEITVKSAANMRCYLNKPEETAEVLQQGWLSTGDLGWVDDEGYVTIVDRKKNIIIRGGENIACLDVEGALHRHPAVQEAGVFAVPDARLGEVVGAGIQLRRGHSVDGPELTQFLADHIAAFKIPEHYWFQSQDLPRGATDKTDRRALRDQCLKRDAS
ncbi:MAG: class I adenylate-forming enzyme family protein [Rhizobiaceae bacterium]